MRWKELSERIERHMERGEELMQLNRIAFERNEAAFDRNTQAFERVMAALDRHEKLFEESRRDRREIEADKDDLKTFIRETNRRTEKVLDDIVRSSGERWMKLHAEMSERTSAILLELREGREEARAQREALLVLIDRLPPPAQAA